MKNLVKNVSLYAIGNILPQIGGFILLPIYTHYLNPVDYGIVSSMQVLSSVLAVIFTLAIERSIYRLYFDYKTENDKKNFLGTITISMIFISVFVLLLIFIFREFIGHIFKTIEFYPYYVYAIFTTFFSVFSIVPKMYFQINENAKKFVSISILQFLLNAGFTLWFVIGSHTGAAGMLKGAMMANLVVIPLFIYILYKTINLSFKIQILKDSIAYSLPMIPALLSSWIISFSDRIFIERYVNLFDVGIYSLAYKIAGLSMILSLSINLAYDPLFYRLANSENQIEAKQKLYNYKNIIFNISMIIVFLVIFFSKEVIIILLDPKYSDAYKIVPILCFTNLLAATTGLFNLMIYQEKRVTSLMILVLVTSVLNVILNFILVPLFGMFGSAYASLISAFVLFTLSYLLAKKCYFISFNWKQIFAMFLSLLIVLIIFYSINVHVYISLFLKLIVCLIFGFFYMHKYYNSIKSIFVKTEYK